MIFYHESSFSETYDERSDSFNISDNDEYVWQDGAVLGYQFELEYSSSEEQASETQAQPQDQDAIMVNRLEERMDKG